MFEEGRNRLSALASQVRIFLNLVSVLLCEYEPIMSLLSFLPFSLKWDSPKD
jgi:hypothetical protein